MPTDSKPESLEAHKIKTAFFTHPTLTEIGRRLVSHYFLLTEEELTMWEEDPESFGAYESGKTNGNEPVNIPFFKKDGTALARWCSF